MSKKKIREVDALDLLSSSDEASLSSLDIDQELYGALQKINDPGKTNSSSTIRSIPKIKKKNGSLPASPAM